VSPGADSSGYLPSVDLTGDSKYWRVTVYDSYIWNENSVIYQWNPTPLVAISNYLDTVSLNGIVRNETGIIPGATLFVRLYAVNSGADTADNFIIFFPVPNYCVYSDSVLIDASCIVEWSTTNTFDQSFYSTDFTVVQPAAAADIKWVRLKKHYLPANAGITNYLKFVVK